MSRISTPYALHFTSELTVSTDLFSKRSGVPACAKLTAVSTSQVQSSTKSRTCCFFIYFAVDQHQHLVAELFAARWDPATSSGPRHFDQFDKD